jgi:hypothetical protein
VSASIDQAGFYLLVSTDLMSVNQLSTMRGVLCQLISHSSLLGDVHSYLIYAPPDQMNRKNEANAVGVQSEGEAKKKSE